MSQDEAPLSVSAALALAKGSLEGISVRIVGEVSEVSKPGYKAMYFTVKDTASSLPCLMWANRYRSAGVTLAVGMLVEITGHFTLYALKGRMNFDVLSIELAGEGRLRMQVAALARKLEAEGLTSQARKRALPLYPERIGLVTSPRGAAVHDVLRTLRKRFPLTEVLVAGVLVEGPSAPAGIIEGINATVRAGAEVVLVVRGGGSFEDLMPFNDEALARAVAACPVPVVTGIGHERDNYLCDMVSDARVSTPTAAAEAISPSRKELSATFARYARSLKTALMRKIEKERTTLTSLSTRPLFRDSAQLFATDAQTLDFYTSRLTRVLPSNIERDTLRLDTLLKRFKRSGASMLSNKQVALDAIATRTAHCGRNLVLPYERVCGLAAARLHSLSPLAVLSRGYAFAQDTSGQVVKSVSQVKKDDALCLTVSDGAIQCRVEGVEPKTLIDDGITEKKEDR